MSDEQKEKEEKAFRQLSQQYKDLAGNVLILNILFALVVAAILLCNKIGTAEKFSPLQHFFLLLSLVVLFAAIIRHLQYFQAAGTADSYLSDSLVLALPARNKSLTERMVIIRKTVGRNNGLSLTGLLLVLFVLLAALQPAAVRTAGMPSSQRASPIDTILYTLAIQDASQLAEEKISKTLVAINAGTMAELEPVTINNETYLTVYAATTADEYTAATDSNKIYSTQGGFVRVFTRKDFFEKYKPMAGEDSVYRVLQLLGLPPAFELCYIVRFLVKPDDLFRPCPDTEIADTECTINAPAGTAPAQRRYVQERRRTAFNNAAMGDNEPFTQLGYTKDWSPYNFSHIGVSEFVIDAYKKVKLLAVLPAIEFLRTGMKGYKKRQ